MSTKWPCLEPLCMYRTTCTGITASAGVHRTCKRNSCTTLQAPHQHQEHCRRDNTAPDQPGQRKIWHCITLQIQQRKSQRGWQSQETGSVASQQLPQQAIAASCSGCTKNTKRPQVATTLPDGVHRCLKAMRHYSVVPWPGTARK